MREVIWEVFGKPWKGCCHSKSMGKALKSLSSSVADPMVVFKNHRLMEE